MEILFVHKSLNYIVRPNCANAIKNRRRAMGRWEVGVGSCLHCNASCLMRFRASQCASWLHKRVSRHKLTKQILTHKHTHNGEIKYSSVRPTYDRCKPCPPRRRPTQTAGCTAPTAPAAALYAVVSCIWMKEQKITQHGTTLWLTEFPTRQLANPR